MTTNTQNQTSTTVAPTSELNQIKASGNTIVATKAALGKFADVAELFIAGADLTLKGDGGFAAAFFLADAITRGKITIPELRAMGITLSSSDYCAAYNAEGCTFSQDGVEAMGLAVVTEHIDALHM